MSSSHAEFLPGRIRPPKQERSRRRVQQLLEAAENILAVDGYEALTMRRLTADAGVPMGTVYQFFDDKDAIVEVLARRYIEEYAAEIEAIAAGAQLLPREARIAAVIDGYIAKYRTSRSFRAIWAGAHLSAELRRADDDNNEALIRIGVGLLHSDDDTVDTFQAQALETALRVAVCAHEGLIHRAFRDDPDGDTVLLEESKILVRLYLDDATERARRPSQHM